MSEAVAVQRNIVGSAARKVLRLGEGAHGEALTLAILELWWSADLPHEELLWSVRGGEVAEFVVVCSDSFDLAAADCEEITAANFSVLVQAVRDATEVGEEDWGPLLFCSRVRGRRIHPLRMAQAPEPVRALFEAVVEG